MDFPQLIGAFDTPLSLAANCETCKCLYLERVRNGRNQYALYKSHGLKLFSTDTDPRKLVSRGFLELNDHLFDIQDDTVYDLGVNGSVLNSYGPISNDGLLCGMAASINSLFVVSTNILYRLYGGAVTTPATPEPVSAVAVLKGYVFALAATNSRRIYFSVDDGATWNALDYQTFEAGSNALLTMIVDHQELWVFGNRLAQVYTIGADPDAPLVPLSSGIIEMGIESSRAVEQFDNSLCWLGRNKAGELTMCRANGYNPEYISTPAVENAWRLYGNATDAVCSQGTFSINGHSCLRIYFPSANNGLGATWEFDASTQQWNEPAWWNPALAQYERHRGNCYISAFGKTLVGDRSLGYIWEMSPDFYTDFGYPIRWERRAPHITKDGKFLQYKRFDLFMQVGGGSVTPVWLNDHSMDQPSFDAAVGVLLGLGTITINQAVILTRIYRYLPYNQDIELPGPDVMTPLGFFDTGANPQVSMRYSNDGANTFSGYRSRSLGRTGDFNQRIYYQNLGMGRDRVFEISGDSPVKIAIVQGAFEAVSCLR